jgi:hypothetical protein
MANEIELKFVAPEGFIPTSIIQTNNSLRVKFTKYKYKIRQRPFIEKEMFREFEIPEKFKLSKAFTIERGLTPKQFKVKLEKVV